MKYICMFLCASLCACAEKQYIKFDNKGQKIYIYFTFIQNKHTKTK